MLVRLPRKKGGKGNTNASIASWNCMIPAGHIA
jgi:hypothetical protein